MVLAFHRGLAIPTWAIAFLTVALASPVATSFPMPATLFAMAAVGIVLIVGAMPSAWLQTSRSLVRVVPSRQITRRQA